MRPIGRIQPQHINDIGAGRDDELGAVAGQHFFNHLKATQILGPIGEVFLGRLGDHFDRFGSASARNRRA